MAAAKKKAATASKKTGKTADQGGDKKNAAAGIDPKAPLLLVDGSSYLFRAYFALPELSNSKGQPTGAVRGVIAMIRKLAKDYPGSPVAVVFDAPGKTFRDDLYVEYKANREKMPDDLRDQIQPIHDIILAMGLPLLVVPGVEADDVIGTLAAQATAAKRDTIISTGDKDMAQLVTDHVTLVNTMTETDMDRDGVVEKFGVPPEAIIDYLALMGDTVDNIPGVPKVGPKTAAKWLNQWGSLDEIMANADDIGGKIGENLRASLEQLPLSRELTTIRCDLELEQKLGDLVPTEPDKTALTKYFTELEFKTWLEADDAPNGGGAPAPAPEGDVPRNYECVTDEKNLGEWIKRLKKAKAFAFDTETTSINYMEAELVGVSFATQAGHAAYVPVAHDYVGAPAQLSLEFVLGALKPLLEDEQVAKIGQNLKYDISVLAKYDVAIKGEIYDTMLESYVLNSVGSRHNMDVLAERHLGRKTIHFEDIAGKGAKQLTFNEIALEQASEYAAEDADIALQLHEVLWPQLQGIESLRGVYCDIEAPLIPILSTVERHGALVDGRLLAQHSAELADRIEALKAEAWLLADEEFNLDSPKQLQRIFYEKLELPVLKKTPKGQPSTAEPVLVDLARDFELPRDHSRVPRPRQAEVDLHRQAAAADQRGHEAYPHVVSPGRRSDGTVIVGGSQPAEHPDPNRGGATHPPGLRGADGHDDGRGRLFADRASDHGAPVARREPLSRVRRRAGHPPRDRRRGVRAGTGGRRGRAASQRQGDQLRAHLRHVGVRARQASSASPARWRRTTSIATSTATQGVRRTWTTRAC